VVEDDGVSCLFFCRQAEEGGGKQDENPDDKTLIPPPFESPELDSEVMGTLLELSCLDGIVPGKEGLAGWDGGAGTVNMSRQDGRLKGKARSFF